MPLRPPDRFGRSALLFACLFPTLATWLYFIRLSGTDWATAAYAATKVIQFAFPVVFLLLVGLLVGEDARVPRKAGTGKGLLLSVLQGTVSGGIFVAAALAFWRPILDASPAFERAPAAVSAKIAGFGIDSGLKFLLLSVFYSVIHSFLEEYYWRWFVFGRLRRRLPFGAAAAVSSLAFTAHHVLVVGHFLGSFGLLTFLISLVVTGAGLVWSWLYERTGRLAGPWLSHALADAVLMWIGYLMWKG